MSTRPVEPDVLDRPALHQGPAPNLRVVRPGERPPPASPPEAASPPEPASPPEAASAVGRAPLNRRRARAAVAATAALALTAVFSLVLSHVLLTQGQFRLERLQARLAEEQARYDRLRLEVAELESPERVVAAAQERLGMVPPPGVTYLSPSGPATSEPAPSQREARAANRREEPLEAAGVPGRWGTIKRNLAAHP